jgi:serine/threonine protein kinase
MRYLHSCGVWNRDLRPENILLDWDWNVRIADFGHSLSREFLQPLSAARGGVWAMTPSVNWHYLAPECYRSQYGPRSDVFSFGLILYELVAGRSAFAKGLSDMAVAKLVVVDEFRPEIPDSVLPAVKQLITDCWHSN